MNTGVRRHAPNGFRCRLLTLVVWLLSLVGIPAVAPANLPQEFLSAKPGYQYRFPQDHGAHEGFRTEWWYYTGHLTAGDDRRFGFELTFFRRGIPPDSIKTIPSEWSIRHLYLAHFALTDLGQGRFSMSEKVSRAGLGKAGAAGDGLRVWIDQWSAVEDSDGTGRQRLQANTDDFAIDLTVTPSKSPIVHGGDGISRKGADPSQASHYYSLTRLATEGRIRVGSEWLSVTGLSWMDHEFGSSGLGADIVGWDWFSLQLSDNTEVMWYRLRHGDGSDDPASSGTVILTDGSVHPLAVRDVTIEARSYWTSPKSGARYPQQWKMTAPSIGLDLDISSLLPEQELQTPISTQVTYWEGAVKATGRSRGTTVSGDGYVELTGYASRFGKKL
ncbi:MAG: carotenoid 1,2-hydratase [Nitrospiraceae bacterium]|nr:carotenoid 1,2-hydratase [Nitrospiraceae bacterium]